MPAYPSAPDPRLGIDFGTSNSAADYLVDGLPRRIEMTPGRTSLPTTFFFDFDTRRTLIGDPAVAALLDGVEGRFMRALKRVLGTPLMHESRQILNERVTFVDIVGRSLREIRLRAEAQAGIPFKRVLSGRPVVFHGAGDPREAQAEADLRACYHAAGFADVAFLAEPEAAAIASGARESGAASGIGLIVDIGGGTSDFSLFRSEPRSASGAGGVDILASHGVRVGGTDFDRAIGIARVMPLLGHGTQLRREFGPGFLPVPNALFNDLATWEKIPFLYTAQHLRAARDMARMAKDPETLVRLVTVLEDRLGHDLAFAVERGKIDANGGDGDARIKLDVVERGLGAALSGEMLTGILAPFARDLTNGAAQTLRLAGLDAASVDRVIYVGGSSRMHVVGAAMTALFPNAINLSADVFGAVADGLAIAAGQGVTVFGRYGSLVRWLSTNRPESSGNWRGRRTVLHCASRSARWRRRPLFRRSRRSASSVRHGRIRRPGRSG